MARMGIWNSRRWSTGTGMLAALLLGGGVEAWAIVTDEALVEQLEEGTIEHADQGEIVHEAGSDAKDAFEHAFERVDVLFGTRFNALDGVGANVGDGARFSRFPRADMSGKDAAGRLMWASHFPERATGPNSETCTSCHNIPVGDGGGDSSGNAIRDPGHTGDIRKFVSRNAPATFGLGALQRLAEEMTQKLKELRVSGQRAACAAGAPVTVALEAKKVSFGSLTVSCDGTVDAAGVAGIDPDIVVKPFQWKGSVAFIRDFTRGAAHNELGMQSVELVGDGVDGDGDGVVNEMTIGDQTALALYQAGQPRPVTKLELAKLGLLKVSDTEEERIARGGAVFSAVQCGGCHIPQLRVNSPIFSEPSQMAEYRDARFPSGQDPVAMGVDPAHPITFDLTRDTPENQIQVGDHRVRLGAFKKDSSGRAIVNLFGDLKRHDMGQEMAESIDEAGTGASMWMTENLWGVGSTPPYLHDGRASTLTEAIVEHGGEATGARVAFMAASPRDQADLLAFLNNLILSKPN